MLEILLVDTKSGAIVVKYSLNGIIKMKLFKDWNDLDCWIDQHQHPEN